MFVRILQQSFRRQRRRKLLAGLAVVAGMTVAAAMLTLRLNLSDDLSRELQTFGANLQATPAADSLPVTLNGVDLRPARVGALLAEADLPKIKQQMFWANNILAFAPLLQTPVRVAGRTVTLEGAWLNHAVAVAGGPDFRTGLEPLSPSWRIEGRWPREDADEVLAGRRLGLAVGERLTLESGETSAARAVTVSGLVATGGAEDGELIAPLEIAQQLAGRPGQYRRLLVSAITKPDDAFARRDFRSMSAADQERWSCSPYAASIAQNLRDTLPGAAVEVIRPVAETEGAVLAKLRLLILLITLVALLASALAIGGVMTAAVLERRTEIALMKAVGAADAAVGRILYCEAALAGLGGGAMGFLAGEWLATAIARQVLGHAVAWKPALAPLILLLGTLVALLGSLTPLRRALRIHPAEVLRGDA